MNEKEQFAKVAKSFCEWVEADQHDLAKCRILLLELLLKVTALNPDIESTDTDKDYPHISNEERRARFFGLCDLPFQYYNNVTPHENIAEAELTLGDVCDDLTDIYADLMYGLQAWQVNDENEAVWHWHYHHRIHWGSHAAHALFVIDEYIRS